MNNEAQIREIAERVAASYGLEVVNVELLGGGKARVLRIFIDRLPAIDRLPEQPSPIATVVEPGEGRLEPGATDAVRAAGSGVTLEDCQNVSREVSTILGVEDVVPGASYTLEVSSPGLDRKLVRPRDYERFVGSRVRLVTREPVNGQNHFEGRLESFRDGRLALELGTSKKSTKSKKKSEKRPVEEEGAPARVEIELRNVERANLVPEF
jgi:ribosome maturation factor RimP